MSIEKESTTSTSAQEPQSTTKMPSPAEKPEMQPVADKNRFESIDILLEENDDAEMDDESIYDEDESMLKEAEDEEVEDEQATKVDKEEQDEEEEAEEEEEEEEEEDDDDEFMIDVEEIQEDLNVDSETNPFDPIDPANIISGKRARKPMGTGSSVSVSNQ